MKLLAQIKEAGLTPNEFYVLYYLNDEKMFVNYINNINLLMYLLETKKLIIKEDNNYVLSNKGLQLMEKFIVKENIDQDKVILYNGLFPNVYRQNSRIPYRTNTKEVTLNFKWFFKTYPQFADWNLILEATKDYIQSFNSDYTYMKTSGYFIKKSDASRQIKSELANVCECSKNGLTKPHNDGYVFFD